MPCPSGPANVRGGDRESTFPDGKRGRQGLLGFSLRPLPDEVLYGLVARLYRITGSDDILALARRMFKLGRPSPGIPVNVSALAGWLADGNWSTRRLVQGHTHLPYYERFVSPEALLAMRIRVLGGAGPSGRTNILAQVRYVRELRSCPECVRTDLAGETGEVGWRRVHTLPGVTVCPEHTLPLRTRTGLFGPSNLVTAPASPDQCGSPVQGLERPAALAVARGSRWLLENPGPCVHPRSLRTGLLSLLREAGWFVDGAIRVGFRREMAGYLGAKALEDLDCRVPPESGSNLNWVRRMWAPTDRWQPHPLRYLLMLAFIRRDVADLFEAARGATRPPRVSVDEGHGIQFVTDDWAPLFPIEGTRQQLVEALARQPNASREEVVRGNGGIVSILRRHDPDWLDGQLPPWRWPDEPTGMP